MPINTSEMTSSVQLQTLIAAQVVAPYSTYMDSRLLDCLTNLLVSEGSLLPLVVYSSCFKVWWTACSETKTVTSPSFQNTSIMIMYSDCAVDDEAEYSDSKARDYGISRIWRLNLSRPFVRFSSAGARL